MQIRLVSAILASSLALGLTGCTPADDSALVIYAGRSESLIQPLIDKYSEETGIEVEVRYAGSAELAAQLLEEGANTPADVFLAQDAGALGAVSKAGLLKNLNTGILELVDQRYRARNGTWVGVSGRVRVLNYNPSKVSDLPESVLDLSKPQYKGRVGIAPSNASFQAFVTAMRFVEGEAATLEWLKAMKVNGVIYEKNSAILEAVESGQVDMGLINHYYWYARAKEVGKENMTSRLTQFASNDVGNLRNVAGVGVTSSDPKAEAFVRYLLSAPAQQYFVEQTFEYPLIREIQPYEGLTSLSDIPVPDFDLNDLDALEQTLDLIRQAGLL